MRDTGSYPADLIVIAPANLKEMEALMTAAQYEKYLEKGSHA